MEIAFLMRGDALTKRGGDTLQVEKYVEQLTRLPGVGARLVTDTAFDLVGIDVAHLVNIDRPLETYAYFRTAQRRGVRTVLSSIHHPYGWIDEFEGRGRYGLLKYVNLLTRGFHARENVKNIVRAVTNAGARRCVLSGLGKPLLAQQREVLLGVDHCFLLAHEELDYIERDFGVVPRASSVVPNAVQFPSRGATAERDIDVLVVGRIEERKNQLGIIDALRGTGLRVVFIGALNGNNKKYTSLFLEKIAADPLFEYPGVVSHDLVAGYFCRAKVHLSASWFEVTPLVDIEAHRAGCAIVATSRGFSREYFGGAATYVEPSSAQSIAQAVAFALSDEGQALRTEVQGDSAYTWESAARLLHQQYLAATAGEQMFTAAGAEPGSAPSPRSAVQ